MVYYCKRETLPMKQLIVLEILYATPGKTTELKEALLKIVPVVLQEQGCIQYEIAESTEGINAILVFMRWENSADLAAHEQSALILDFIRKYDHVLYHSVEQTVWNI